MFNCLKRKKSKVSRFFWWEVYLTLTVTINKACQNVKQELTNHGRYRSTLIQIQGQNCLINLFVFVGIERLAPIDISNFSVDLSCQDCGAWKIDNASANRLESRERHRCRATGRRPLNNRCSLPRLIEIIESTWNV